MTENTETKPKKRKIAATMLLSEETVDRLNRLKAESDVSKVVLIEKAIRKMLDKIDRDGVGCIFE